MIITIDGPAGSGKSTVADILAEKLNYIHFNSGALFRGLTAHLITIGFDISSITETSSLPNMQLTVKMTNDIQHVLVNGIDYTSVLRNNEVSKVVPIVSLNEKIQKTAQNCLKQFY